MAYARIPDELCSDDRYLHAVDLHPAAGTLVLFGYSYSAREATDGYVPARQYRRWLGDREQTDAAVAALVEAGLWEAADGGHLMLDYTHARRNITRAEWEERREAERVRKAEWRARVNAERAAAAADEAATPDLSRRDTARTDAGTPAGQDAGPTPDATRDDRVPDAGRTPSVPEVSLAREGAPADAQTQIQTRTQTQTENTATASRAGALEPPAGGGGDLDDEVHPMLDGARRAVQLAGFGEDEVKGCSGSLTTTLRDREREPRLPRPDWSTFDWVALGEWLAEERRAKRAKATRPQSVLRYGLWSLSQPGTPALRGPGTSRPPAGRRPAAEVPEPAPLRKDSDLGRAWTAIVEDARRQIGDQSWDTWLSVIRVHQLHSQSLELWAPAHGREWIADRLLPLLSASATRILDREMTATLVGVSS